MTSTLATPHTNSALTGHFDSVLIANRGEIACRVIETVHKMGLRAIAVYSDADQAAPHVRLSDDAIRLGPATATESYLDIDKVIEAAKLAGAGAIHPGYGFLSENAAFAKRCEEEGIVFIGPPASAIDLMGDKITARDTVESRDVPTVPGISRPGLTDQDIIDAAPEIGFPVLIKPSAGGGGKGMHRVENIDDLAGALVSARREAASSFGDDALFLEHFVDTPRHIEVQIVADSHGNVIHLGERECSLQRRHQKVIEEAPSALLDATTRAEIGEAACDAARAAGYCGAGTVEFIVSAKDPERFFFMEMNTRLQVEHPVTELVTGIDLVEWQIRVALGEELPMKQEDVTLTGHAVEARVYAEDPAGGFLPTGGLIKDIQWPTGAGVRVDAGVVAGQEVGSDYDPMLAKLITWAPTREAALQRLDKALGATVIDGLTTNLDFNRFLVTYSDVVAGDLDTGLLDRIVDTYEPTETPAAAFAVAALGRTVLAQDNAVVEAAAGGSADAVSALGSVWTRSDSWRGAAPAAPLTMTLDDGSVIGPRGVIATAHPAGGATHPGEIEWSVDVTAVSGLASENGNETDDATETIRLSLIPGARNGGDLRIRVDDGTAQNWQLSGDHLLGPEGAYTLTEFHGTAADASATVADTAITSPMPGTIIAVEVASGDAVTEGQAVIVMEAMKMEHTLTAATDGTATVNVAVGDKVGTGDVLADVTPDDNA